VQRKARVQKLAINTECDDKKPVMTTRMRKRGQEIYQVALSTFILYCEYGKKCHASALKKTLIVRLP
jgi:hypothetical protein